MKDILLYIKLVLIIRNINIILFRSLSRPKGIPVTIFELVKVTLDELYTQGLKQYGENLDTAILHRMFYLSDSYRQLRNPARKPVDYKDTATRFAYVYKYVAAHGDYLIQVMQRLLWRVGSTLFTDKIARVTCVGGGPGTDIIAVLKYLDEHNKEKKVEEVICYLLDKEQAWSDTWAELTASLPLPLPLNRYFRYLDVTDLASWKCQQKFLQADLFTMSYFVSEVCYLKTHGDISKFWSTLFQGAKPGALFVYIDNGHKNYGSYFDAQWQAAGLTCLICEDQLRWRPRNSEEASEVDIYRQKFRESPKLNGFLSYRVLRKE